MNPYPVFYNPAPPLVYNSGPPLVYTQAPPLVYTPPPAAGFYAPPILNPLVNIPVQPIVRTQAVCLSVGQESAKIPMRNGLSDDCFFVGEAVSVSGTDGRNIIAQVTAVSPSGMVVNVGSGKKEFTPTEVITHVSKLLGVYYIPG